MSLKTTFLALIGAAALLGAAIVGVPSTSESIGDVLASAMRAGD